MRKNDKKHFLVLLLILIQCNYFEDAKSKSGSFLKFLGIRFTSTALLEISSVLPKDKSINNYRNTNIFITFNKNFTGFNANNFTVATDNKIPIAGRIEINEKVLSFYPGEYLLANSTYTILLKAENGLTQETSFTFSTGTLIDTTPPTLVITNPSNGDKDIPINIFVTATMSEEIDPNTLNFRVFKIIDVSGNTSLEERTLVLKPNANLPSNTNVIVTLNSGLKDLAGNVMTNPSAWIFTTGTTIASDCVYDASNYNSCIGK